MKTKREGKRTTKKEQSDTQRAFRSGFIGGSMEGMLFARKKTAKEILQRLYDKCYEAQGLRGGYAHIIPLDILILAKEYGVEVEE